MGGFRDSARFDMMMRINVMIAIDPIGSPRKPSLAKQLAFGSEWRITQVEIDENWLVFTIFVKHELVERWLTGINRNNNVGLSRGVLRGLRGMKATNNWYCDWHRLEVNFEISQSNMQKIGDLSLMSEGDMFHIAEDEVQNGYPCAHGHYVIAPIGIRHIEVRKVGE